MFLTACIEAWLLLEVFLVEGKLHECWVTSLFCHTGFIFLTHCRCFINGKRKHWGKFRYVSVRRAFSSEEFENADSDTTQQIIFLAISRCNIIIISDLCILAGVSLSSYPAGEEEATGKHYFLSSLTWMLFWIIT